MTTTETETVVELAENTTGRVHLPCGVHVHRPDEPVHAVCGVLLLGIPAPAAAANKCPTCLTRWVMAGGPFTPVDLYCDEHQGGAR